MPDYTIRDPQTGKTVTVRGNSPPSEAELSLIFKSVNTQTEERPSTNRGLITVAAGKAIPLATRAVTELATHPNVPKVAAQVGRIGGAIAPIVAGAVEGGPVGALVGVAASAKSSWLGGKTGWFTGKLLQKVTAPIATVLTKAAPYAQAITTIGGVQSGLDLMQILEPNRKDIGVMGISTSSPEDVLIAHGMSKEDAKKYFTEHPPLINLAVTKLRDAFNQLLGHGLTKEEAATLLVRPSKESTWAKRADGSDKGKGFLGVLQRSDGSVSSEISISVNIDGKEVEIPTLVPTLTIQEQQWLLSHDVSDPRKLPSSIVQKAIAFARPRLAAGKSPFAESGESP